MKSKTSLVKYSIFGDYVFINYTPDNVSKLYDSFRQENFMPNMIPMIKIESKNTLRQLNRLQIIRNEPKCIISILPERIDVETGDENNIEQVIDYLEKIVDGFCLKINRMAYNRMVDWEELNKSEQNFLLGKLQVEDKTGKEDDVVEFLYHKVTRKNFDALKELINIGKNIKCFSSVSDNADFNKVQIETDINTRGEVTQERFDLEACKKFFNFAVDVSKEIFANMEVLIHDQ